MTHIIQNASHPCFCVSAKSAMSFNSRLQTRFVCEPILIGSNSRAVPRRKRGHSYGQSTIRSQDTRRPGVKIAGLAPIPCRTLLSIGAGREPATHRPNDIEDMSGSLQDHLLRSAAEIRYYIIVLENKGGVGKSAITQTAAATLYVKSKRILLLDADAVNSNLSRVGLTETKAALRANRADFEGFLFDAAEQLTEGDVDGVVIDSGAGGEEYFRPHLAGLAEELRRHGARLIIMRPLTLSPFVQDNIITFTREVMTADMACVIVRNLTQGRVKEDFQEWLDSPERAEVLAKGVVECDFETVGAKYSDLVVSVRRTFMDVALKPTRELDLEGRDLEIAERHFTRPVRLFLSRWLLRQTTGFANAFLQSVARVPS